MIAAADINSNLGDVCRSLVFDMINDDGSVFYAITGIGDPRKRRAGDGGYISMTGWAVRLAGSQIPR